MKLSNRDVWWAVTGAVDVRGAVSRAVIEGPPHPGLQDFLYEVPPSAGTQEHR